MSGRVVGVCSWSLRPGSARELVDLTQRVGVRAVQLHLDPIRVGAWDAGDVRTLFDGAGIEVRSAMMTMQGEDYSSLASIARTGGVRPDATWQANLDAARANARIARDLGVGLVTFHAGHLPERADDPERRVMLERLGALIDVFAHHDVRVGFETGQETAETLSAYLDELPGASVNFDPANMILYAMGDPHEALERLGPRVSQIHIKDATATDTPGTWGAEVPAGAGQVDWARFLSIAGGVCPDADLMIEREAGPSRVEDIRTARALVERLAGSTP